MNGKVLNDRISNCDLLLQEILSGEMIRDVLPDPSYDFAGERQARYYTNMRWNLESDMALMLMEHHQQNSELQLLKKWGIYENK